MAITARTPSFRRDDVADRLLIIKLKRYENFVSEARLINEVLEYRHEIMSEVIYTLAYALMLYTGLRVNETRQLIWADVNIKEKFVRVRPKTTKNSKATTLPLHSYLIELLKEWKLKHPDSRQNDRIVKIPTSNSSFLKVFNKDLDYAGIEKTDELGRVIHLHALRHSFASLLARQGVHPHVLQALARHSDIKTTMNLYIHVLRGDDVSAIESLKQPKETVNKHKRNKTA